jgi:hypothetical protein
MGSDYKTMPTTYEVWSAIRKAHPDMVVYGSYSAPMGDYYGDPSKGRMFTSYGFKQGNYPIIEAETTWKINHDKPEERINEVHKYWLCLPNKNDD